MLFIHEGSRNTSDFFLFFVKPLWHLFFSPFFVRTISVNSRFLFHFFLQKHSRFSVNSMIFFLSSFLFFGQFCLFHECNLYSLFLSFFDRSFNFFHYFLCGQFYILREFNHFYFFLQRNSLLFCFFICMDKFTFFLGRNCFFTLFFYQWFHGISIKIVTCPKPCY